MLASLLIAEETKVSPFDLKVPVTTFFAPLKTPEAIFLVTSKTGTVPTPSPSSKPNLTYGLLGEVSSATYAPAPAIVAIPPSTANAVLGFCRAICIAFDEPSTKPVVILAVTGPLAASGVTFSINLDIPVDGVTSRAAIALSS